MHKRFVRFLLLGAGILLLSGCITQQTATKVNGDGSGTNEMIVGISKEILSMGGTDGEDPFADAQKSFAEMPKEWNATSAPWEDEKYKGIKLSTKFSDAAMLEEQLNRLMGPASKGEGDSKNPTSGMYESFDVQQEGGTFIIKAKVNTSLGSDAETAQIPAEMLSSMKVSWSVEMPNLQNFTEQDIAKRENNKVTWTFPLGTKKTYNVEARGSFGGAASGLLLYGLIALVGIGVVVAGVFLLRRKSAPAADGTMVLPQDGPYPQPDVPDQPPPQQPPLG